MKHLLISLFFISSSLFASAQNNFTGDVYLDDQPLVGATISSPDHEALAITSVEGSFQFTSSRQNLVVIIHYLGQQSKHQLEANTWQHIALTDIAFDIEPVFVSSKYPISQTTISTQSLASENLGQDLPILLPITFRCFY